MSKHTLGSWIVIGAQKGFIISTSDGIYDVAIVRDIGNQDNEANAKLIAAAPDLLEALIVLSGSHPEVAMASDDELRASIMHCDDPIGVAQAGALLKARAAIKKATE